MSTSNGLPLKTVDYSKIRSTWPKSGRHILASFDSSKIILYQAYNAAIAEHAVAHQTFLNCPQFSTTRMTWLKPNFLWMMYRSGWGKKKDQEHILAITISRQGFEEILRNATLTSKSANQSEPMEATDVRIQWDPDHDPKGDKEVRRAIQLGIKAKILDRFLNEWILGIEDISGFVKEQAGFVEADRLDCLQVPEEKLYRLEDESLARKIQLDEFMGS